MLTGGHLQARAAWIGRKASLERHRCRRLDKSAGISIVIQSGDPVRLWQGSRE